jgi:two-component system chemotaxis response regulator CheB
MKKITVLIVDDSALIRHVFRELLSEAPDIEVLDTACDPLEAREKIKQLNPDVLTLDIEMPKMDGLSFLEKIMALRPMPVIMVSTLTQKGAGATIRALETGAFDYVSKPVGTQTRDGLQAIKEELTEKIRAASKANLKSSHSVQKTGAPSVLSFKPPAASQRVIAIGSSTGGVEALRDIFLTLPANSPPIVMTQHMPHAFTGSFAARLNSLSQVEVSEATDGAKLQPGFAYLAPGNMHMKIIKKASGLYCALDDGPHVTGHKPSVDVLFESVATQIGQHAVGVMLTGMGKDGAQGMLKMREAGAYNVGQSASSCVVYGMPKAAMAAGAVHTELPLSEIAAHILNYCEGKENARAS